MLNLREGWECILDSVAGHKPLALQLGLNLNQTDFFKHTLRFVSLYHC